jgi:hypothetical protein
MENRFLSNSSLRPAPAAVRRPIGGAQPFSRAKSVYARSFSAEQRALVILIENGGIDLEIPAFVDRILAALPGTNLLPESARQQLIVFVHDTIKGFTDTLLETADLALNRYSAAKPDLFGSVTVLRNSTATYDDLKGKLIALSKEGRLIDLFVLTHGSDNEIAVGSGITGEMIKRMRAEYGKPLSIRCVYMMNCKGSTLNQAWLDAGAKAVAGTIGNNYLPEPTNYFFWQNWKAGQPFETAVNSAYRKTINLMNDAVKSFLSSLVPGLGTLVDFDFESMEFVRDSAPVISGQRTVTVSTDDLAFAQSLSSRLATTVLPLSVIRSLASGGRDGNGTGLYSHTSSYHSPSTMMSLRREYSRQQNPAAVLIAGIEVADAIQIGLGAAAIVQSQVNGSAGSFQLVYSTAQRLLTPEARGKMPGSQTTKQKYSRRFMHLGASNLIMNLAQAEVIIEWEGNPYGEIGTPVIRRELLQSTEWSKSSASIVVQKVDRIPLPGTDPRAWPIVYSYDGSYDPAGNGQFEFSGEFEINAFGGLRFTRHDVVSRSLIDAVLRDRDKFVVRGEDAVVATPPIPQEQVNYLKSALPPP